jgi:hypothetical protein
MPTTPLFPLPEGLELTAISQTGEELLVHVILPRPLPLNKCSSVMPNWCVVRFLAPLRRATSAVASVELMG